jgi:amino acid adenylation domain-containing protein
MGTLSDAQRTSLAARLRQGRTAAGTIPRRAPEVRELPLSFGQEQLWFIDQFAPGLPVYNIASALRLHGKLDAAALGRALDDLVARHEVLRSRLVNAQGRPLQVIDPPCARRLVVDNLSAYVAAARDTRLRELAKQEAASPFDLAAGPLFRARLICLSSEEHVLLVCAHHSVFDGWSFEVFIRELSMLYQAHATGQAASLPEMPVQFADYALWERQRLQGELLQDLVDYWRTALDGLSTMQMPTDRPRPLLQSFDGGFQKLNVDSDVLDGLKLLSRQAGSTLFVTLLAAVQVLVHRYTGQDDIVVGTASANRSRPELAPLIGYLVNTLPIRTDTSGDPTFVDLLRKVRTTTIDAYAHQDLPFARLVEALRVERDPSRSPLFQIVFTMVENPDTDIRAGDVSIRPESVDVAPAKVDLQFFIETRPSGMCVSLSYATALFDDATARRMLEHLRVLVTGIAADPTRRLSQLPLLTPEELQRELVEWNDTAVVYPPSCVHQLFEQQVERAADGIAAVFGDNRWTYAQLNAHANQIARTLHQRGVGAETLVGISMPPSLHRLAAVLGVLKAGAGYVPLDPDLPAERLDYMIDDADIPIVLTTTAAARPTAAAAAEIMPLDQYWPAISRQPVENPDYPVGPQNVAYVLYTSGSTGRPKGVVVEHGTVVNYLHGMLRHFTLGPDDRWLQFASLSFDVSVLDMFISLCSGATTVFDTLENLHSPPRLAALMRHHKVSFACLPPAVVNLLADEALPDLRVLISAGDALASDVVEKFLRPGLHFYNGYGPTETTCGVTLMQLDATTPLPPPIGGPLSNYKAYVLDAHLNPLPVGATGELYVGGPVHARGYLKQPALTEQRWIPDPFSSQPDARLYRTGDLVRRLSDGNMQFIGRIDNQVKIRGLRVELGEIEVALTTHPAIVEALVLAIDDAAGQKQLIGYARVNGGTIPLASADLRQHLARQLPSYMIPAHFVVLDQFPLNSSGKIDRRALPKPDTSSTEHAPPRTLLETLLVDLYTSLLARADIGIDDSFFEIGGNSLQAMQLISRLHTDLAVDTDVTAIFLAPTPRQLAALLSEKHGLQDAETAVANPTVVDLTNGSGGQPLFFFHAISGSVYPYAHLTKELTQTYNVCGVEAAGLSEASTAVADLDQMVSAYTDAIRAAQPTGPYRLGGWSMGGLLAFEVARTLQDLGEIVAMVVLLDTPYALPVDLPATESQLAALFVTDVSHSLGWSSADMAALDFSPDADHLGWLCERLAAGAGSIDGVRADIQRRFEVFKANTYAIAGYRPKTKVRTSALIASAEMTHWDSTPLWKTAIDGPVDTLRLPSEHFTLLQPPSVHKIAQAILQMETDHRLARSPQPHVADPHGPAVTTSLPAIR